jgi:parvulin-like peptidyl-prolyl isomerase
MMRTYYREHPSEFGPPDKAKVAVIRVPDAAKASEVVAEVERQTKGRGVDEQFQAFSDLVRRYTNEPGARDVNLSLGVGATAYPKEVSDAAAALKEIGGVSAPIATEDGYFILQLKERTPGSAKPFEEVRGHVLRSLSEQIKNRRVAEVVDELSKKLDAHVFKERYADVHFDRREASSAAPARQ